MSSIIIHGHFYQPPRENPWTGMLDPEGSARPFHDWNERIFFECYRPNSLARIFDSAGRIERIVNNYASISFNFGPTLFSWLERHYPDVYRGIIEADRLSASERHGHGNAIAQGYNHAILPLCNARDMRTQINWGIADFRHRFGRKPESLWLPETACNLDTLDALIEFGLKFVILSPYQALRTRRIGEDHWRDVSAGSIDPRRAYRCLHRDGSGRSIAIFFYDATAANAIAFGEALATSQLLVDTLQRAQSGGAMVNVATDGESYGHHHHFGDRSLAYALRAEAPARGFRVTNYGEFLELNPPVFEVELKPGPNGEGTSWSCAHGVGRWYRDCGCHTGGEAGWNQAWRKPLREALDYLRNESARLFETAGGDLFRDPWAARDDYIDLILNGSSQRRRFFSRHVARQLKASDQVRALTLLEMQRSAMLMYTSCGWFFNDISGLESVQILKYASLTMDLMDQSGSVAPRDDFLGILAQAQSNQRSQGTGADIFRKMVQPSRVTPSRLAAHVAISSLTDGSAAGTIGDYEFSRTEYHKEETGRLTLAIGRMQVKAAATGKSHDFTVGALRIGGADLYCAVRPFTSPAQFKESSNLIWSRFNSASLPVLLRLIQQELGPEEFGLADLLPDGRIEICEEIFGDLLENFTAQFGRLYEEYRRVINMMQQTGFELPGELRRIAEFTLGLRFEHEIREQYGNPYPGAYRRAIEVADEVARHHYLIDKTAANEGFSAMIANLVQGALEQPEPDKIDQAVDLIGLAKRLAITPNLDVAQEALYLALEKGLPEPSLFTEMAAGLGLSGAMIKSAPPLTAKPPAASQDAAGGAIGTKPSTGPPRS